MINGRILMSQERMDQLIVEMLSREHTKAVCYLDSELHWHCNIWHFGPKDRQLLQTEIAVRFYEAYKFFDKPIQSGT